MEKNLIIKSVKEYLSNNQFDNSLIKDFFAPDHHYLKFLNSINGEKIDSMDPKYLTFVKQSILSALDISLAAYEASITLTQDQAFKIIEKIRHGLPAHEIMNSTSKSLKRHVKYISKKSTARASDFKIVLGEPGAGKTTFKNLIKQNIDSDNVVFVDVKISSSSYLRSLTILEALIFDVNLIKHVLDLPSEDMVADKDFNKPSLRYGFFRDIIVSTKAFISNENTSEILASNLCYAVSEWLNGSRQALKNFNSIVGSKSKVPASPKSTECSDITDDLIIIYKDLGVYPIWLIDEFESIVTAYKSYKENALDYYRSFHDSLLENGNGFCIIFSTESGFSAIREYPAFISRVKGASDAYSSVIWDLKNINKLEIDTVMPILIDIYKLSLDQDDFLTADSNISEYYKLFEPDIIKIFSAKEVPREKLRSLVMHVLDIFLKESSDIDIFIENRREMQKKELAISSSLPKIITSFDDSIYINSDIPFNAKSSMIDETVRQLLRAINRRSSEIDEKDIGVDNTISSLNVSEDSFLSDPYVEISKLEVGDKNKLLRINHKLKGKFALSNNSVLGFFNKPNFQGDFDCMGVSDIPSCLKIAGKPIDFFEEYPTIDKNTALERLKSTSKKMVTFAKKYSAYRNFGGLWNTDIVSPVEYEYESGYDIDFVFHNLRLIFELSNELFYIPVHVKSSKHKSRYVNILNEVDCNYSIMHLNPLYSLSTIRDFTYSFMLQSGVFPCDLSIDKFVISIFESYSGKSIPVARNGVFFLSEDSLITEELGLKRFEDKRL